MTNSADPDQLASEKPTDLDLYCLKRQVKSGFSRTRVKLAPTFLQGGFIKVRVVDQRPLCLKNKTW